MSGFNKKEFSYYGGYLNYGEKFVARFKYRFSPVTKAKFVKELVASHTPESFFKALEEDRKAPLEILREANPGWYAGLIDAFTANR